MLHPRQAAVRTASLEHIDGQPRVIVHRLVVTVPPRKLREAP
jgi:hypothetical protein